MTVSRMLSDRFVIWLLIAVGGCDFYKLHEMRIYILPDGQGSSQLNEEIARVLVGEGFKEWRDKSRQEQGRAVRVFSIELGKNDTVGLELYESKGNEPVTIVYGQIQVRRFTGHDRLPRFTEAGEDALQSLLRRLRSTLGDKRIVVDETQ